MARYATAFTVGVGEYLLVWAAVLGVLSTRTQIPASGVWTVIVLDVVWIAASLTVAFSDTFDLTGWGVALFIVQVSARHLSFLENGRAKPSRAMMEMPEVSLRERNRLLLAGGSALRTPKVL